MELAILIDCLRAETNLDLPDECRSPPGFSTRSGKLAGTEVIYTLKAGDSFVFDGVTYDVLWPPRGSLPL